jgi:hypothetical protein
MEDIRVKREVGQRRKRWRQEIIVDSEEEEVVGDNEEETSKSISLEVVLPTFNLESPSSR